MRVDGGSVVGGGVYSLYIMYGLFNEIGFISS